MMGSKVSVIVSVYNIEKYIGECIESIINQSYKNIEIILIDDGSTDYSGKIADIYGSKDSRIKVIHQNNLGLVKARRNGVLNSTGYYIDFIDGDDWIDKDYILNLLKTAEESQADLVVSDYLVSFVDYEQLIELKLDNNYFSKNILDDLKNSFLYSGQYYNYKINPALWNKLFKKNLFVRYSMQTPEDISFGEDLATIFPYIQKANSISYYKGNCFYHYRQRKNSMVRGYNSSFPQKLNVLVNYLIECKEKYNKNVDIDYYLSWIIQSVLDNQFKEICTNTCSISKGFREANIDYLKNAVNNINFSDIPLKYKILLNAYRRNCYYVLFILMKYRNMKQKGELVHYYE